MAKKPVFKVYFERGVVYNRIMQILNIGQNLYKNIFLYPQMREKRVSSFNFSGENLRPLERDTVSFKGKDYSIDSIKEPTGHCAYCGTKVYSQEQLESIANEILKLNGNRLNGKIKSILEKLDMPNIYTEIATKRRQINKEHIDYFKKLSGLAYSLSPKNGLDILLLDNKDKDAKAVKNELMYHLKPLMRTVDHITPKRKNNENDNDDLNLVEACYACNHDLKSGLDFNEFNELYPTIEQNMPPHKYQFAMSHVLEDSQSQIKSNISAQKLVSLFETLNAQQTNAILTLNSVNQRLKKCLEDVQESLEDAKKEKTEKGTQIKKLEQEKRTLLANEEYKVRLKQATLSDEMEGIKAKKLRISSTIEGMENKIAELTGTKLAKKPKKNQLSQSEKEKKIEELTENIKKAKLELEKAEKQLQEKENLYLKLSKKYTPIEQVRNEKQKYDDVVEAYLKFAENEGKITEIQHKAEDFQMSHTYYTSIAERPEPPEVKPTDCSEAELEKEKEYKSMIALLHKMESVEFPNPTTKQVYEHATRDIEEQIRGMVSNPLIARAEHKRQRYIANCKLKDLNLAISANNRDLDKLKELQQKLQERLNICTKEEAEKKSQELDSEIKRIETIYITILKITDKINKTKSELKLIETTISNLEKISEESAKVTERITTYGT